MAAVPLVAAVAPPVVGAVVVVVAVALVVVDVGLQQVVAPLRRRHILCTAHAGFRRSSDYNNAILFWCCVVGDVSNLTFGIS